jgi:hypothetical protein
MAQSTRELILGVFETRLAAIDGTGVFSTRAGETLFLMETPNLGPHDVAEAILIVPEPDVVVHQKLKLLIDLPIGLFAVVKADRARPFTIVEAMIADIKRAIELEDRRLGLRNVDSRGIKRGPTTPYQRPDGSLYVGTSIHYTVPYEEGWGAP